MERSSLPTSQQENGVVDSNDLTKKREGEWKLKLTIDVDMCRCRYVEQAGFYS